MGPFQAEGAAWAMTQHLRASSMDKDNQNTSDRSGVWQVVGEKKIKQGEGGRKRERKE